MFEIARKHGTLNMGTLPFLLLQASVLLVFTTYFSWAGLALCALCYLVRMFAITGFYHRYFSHRTYAMGRVMQFLTWKTVKVFLSLNLWLFVEVLARATNSRSQP